jgi:hypothetical protein
MDSSQTSSLFLTKTFVLTFLWAIAIGLPCRAHSPLSKANHRILSRSPIVFSTPDLSGNGRPDDRQGNGASHLSGRK